MSRVLARKPGQAGYNFLHSRALKQVPYLLCAVFLFLYILFFAYRAIAALFYPYSLEYSEGAVFNQASQLWRDGFSPASLYPANDAPPYRSAVYGPLFYYLDALTMSPWGPTTILGGRLISLAAAVFTGYLLYRVASQTELAPGRMGAFLVSLAAALTPFATAAIYSGAVIAKPDMLAVALSLAGTYQVWRAATHQRHNAGSAGPYILAGLLCALALLAKQSALAAPLAVLLWLALSRKWPEALAFCVSWLGGVVSVSLFFQFASGDNFIKHVIGYNAQPFSLAFLGANLNYFIFSHLPLLVLAGAWWLRPLIGRYERFDLWRIYLLTALLVTLSAGKVGSNFNYYIESLCLVSLLAWCQVGRVLALRPDWRPGPLRLPGPALVMVLIAVQLVQLHHIPVIADGAFTPGGREFEQASLVSAKVGELARIGPLLAEDSGWQTALNLPVELDDPFVFGQLAQAGAWNNREFLDRLRRGHYRYAMYEIAGVGRSEIALEAAVKAGTAAPFPDRFEPAALSILQDRSLFKVEQRIGRWLFLKWQGDAKN